VTIERRFATREELSGVVRAAFGADRGLAEVTRLRGGTSKGVYRLTLDDRSTAIAYIWDDNENYWTNPADPQPQTSRMHLFETAGRRLGAAGVRTPRILLTDRDRTHFPADIAVVEDIPGENLDALLQRDPDGAEPVLARLADSLDAMRRCKGPHFGKVSVIDDGGQPAAPSGEQLITGRALGDLAEAARRDPRVGAVRDELEDVVRTLAAAVRPRSDYGLVHGELGPDHVLVDKDGQPVLIDIEDLTYFDVEWEHVFLRIRFGEHYHRLRGDDLDERRLALYMLAKRLSLVAGPLRLLDGDFPHRAGMLEIVEHNLRETLAFLR
jgi:hypothetical protein